jgi:hypothetical protein
MMTGLLLPADGGIAPLAPEVICTELDPGALGIGGGVPAAPPAWKSGTAP